MRSVSASDDDKSGAGIGVDNSEDNNYSIIDAM